MGRKGGGSGFDRSMLLRRLQSCKKQHKTFNSAEDAAEFLRDKYPDYRRLKQQPFTKMVHSALISQQRFTDDDDDDDDDDGVGFATPSRKRIKKSDNSSDSLLLRKEAEYLRSKRIKKSDNSTSSTSSSSSAESEDDGAVSVSEDAIYGERVEPEFDLMKTMLRSSYVQSSSAKKKEKENHPKQEEDRILELEDGKKLILMESNGVQQRKKSNSNASDDKRKSSSDVEIKKDKGPMFKDFGGMRGILEELKEEVLFPLFHPQLPRKLGVAPISGILLHGPPGCGKTTLARAIANETGLPFYMISATEMVSGVSGASEENIRELFSKAYRTAPAIVFIDEIDAIGSKRENLQREMERRIVTQLMTCMDESHKLFASSNEDTNSDGPGNKSGYVLVIGATNRPDAVDAALRRNGRFDREIYLGVPDENARREIFSVLTQNLHVEGAFDHAKIARSTPGYVGADLAALANKAGNVAIRRIIQGRKSGLTIGFLDTEHADEWLRRPLLPEEMEGISITMADFEEAAKMVQPSARREGFSTIPNVTWDDVGGLDLLRQEFSDYIIRRIKSPEDYEEYGVDLQTGFLLYGPPGCGKTLIAKAVAHEAGANFIYIKGPELLNKYVGESELAVRTVFTRARICAPCILFFDEVDALTTRRGGEGGGGRVVDSLLNQLLLELDGPEQQRGVFVIGATNRPDEMDHAILRPGRLGKLLYVPLPNAEERGLILKALARKKPIDPSVDLMAIGRSEACEDLSGADLAALMNEAAMIALKEKQSSVGNSDATPRTINTTHFEQALRKVTPSVSKQKKREYEILSKTMRSV
ncbi:NVL2, nucleolin binding domain [Dillenia turbinata]|uniref:NVL2, nucleolin binding domain n=1 Tax=Dillenia turbinata TaxID=194707 RepID=A0AAN8V7F0_9MAGN